MTEFKFESINNRRKIRGAEAARFQVKASDEEYLLWMNIEQIRENISLHPNSKEELKKGLTAYGSVYFGDNNEKAFFGFRNIKDFEENILEEGLKSDCQECEGLSECSCCGQECQECQGTGKQDLTDHDLKKEYIKHHVISIKKLIAWTQGDFLKEMGKFKKACNAQGIRHWHFNRVDYTEIDTLTNNNFIKKAS